MVACSTGGRGCNGAMWLYATVYGLGLIPILLLNRDTTKVTLRDELQDEAGDTDPAKGN